MYLPPHEEVWGECRTRKFPFIFSGHWVGLGGEFDALTALFPRKEPQVTLE
jgi:hypothetical protein